MHRCLYDDDRAILYCIRLPVRKVMRRAPPPSGSAPQMGLEALEVVKKKVSAPPRGPPPAGMTVNFKGPRQIERHPSSRGAKQDDRYDDDRDRGRNRSDSRDYSDHDDHRAGGKDDPPRRQGHASQQAPPAAVKQKAPPTAEAKAAVAAPSSGAASSSSSSTTAAASTATRKTGGQAVFNFQPVLKSTYRELRHFVLSPCQPGVIVRCYIERNRSGSKMLAPFYSLCADLEDGTGRELAVCRKVLQSRTSHYVFSLKSEDLWRRRDQRSRLYLGKLRAVGHGEYVLYDNGICAAPDEDESLLEEIEEMQNGGPLRADAAKTRIARKREPARAAEAKNSGAKSSDDVSLYRREMAVIKFNAMNRPAPQCVRGLEVCIPAVPSPTALAEAKPASTSTTTAAGVSMTSHIVAQPSIFNLEKPFKKIRDLGRQNDLYGKTCTVLHEKTSRYDPLSACLVEFKGRAHMASIKNFQLVVSDAQAHFGLPSPSTHEQMMRADGDKDFVFMMGKTTEDCFNMDFKYPLSLFQAFAVAVARFDAKLSCAEVQTFKYGRLGGIGVSVRSRNATDTGTRLSLRRK
eukprot:gene6020-7680_t